MRSTKIKRRAQGSLRTLRTLCDRWRGIVKKKNEKKKVAIKLGSDRKAASTVGTRVVKLLAQKATIKKVWYCHKLSRLHYYYYGLIVIVSLSALFVVDFYWLTTTTTTLGLVGWFE